MQREIVNKPQIYLVGCSVRTNNKHELSSPTPKIAALVNHYFTQNIAAQIANRKNPGVTFIVYTEYESNEHGEYTCFIGEEVSSFKNIPLSFQTFTIPAAKYQKFTTPSGKMPDVVKNAWQEIWQMSVEALGGKRTYRADFEVYDQRAMNPNNTSLDIYIGIE